MTETAINDEKLIEEIKEKKKRARIGVLLSRKDINEFMLDDFMNCV